MTGTEGSPRMLERSRVLAVPHVAIVALAALVTVLHGAEAEAVRSYADTLSYFKLEYPEDWTATPAADAESMLRVTFESPQKDEVVHVFAIHAEGDVDVAKLADLDDSTFKEMGERTASRNIRGFLWATKRIAREYNNGSVTSRALYLTHRTFGYVIMWRGLASMSSGYDIMTRSFKASVPWKVGFADRTPGLLKEHGTMLLIALSALGLGLLAYSLRTKRVPFVLAGTACAAACGYFVKIHFGWLPGIGACVMVLVIMVLGAMDIFVELEP